MIDTQSIRTKILDLAMRGRLTEQLPEDGTAEELYQQIQAEKQALIKAGKIKKEKPLPEISEGEKPFEIPKSWKWVRLKDLGIFSGGKTPLMANKAFWENGVFPWVTSKDMKQKYIASSEMLISEAAAKEMVIHPAKTVLFVVRSGILRRLFPVAILRESATINQDLKALDLYFPDMCEYVYYALKGFESTILFKYTKDGTTVNNIIFESLLTMPVPIPPLAEQKRIVDRVQQAFSALDTIDELQTKYADNLNVLKSKLIDAAIQGKLTEQLPEDGTAEELYQQIQEEKQFKCESGEMKKPKLLSVITPEEIPFVGPDHWRWCRLESLYNFIDYRGATPNKTTEGVPFVTAKNVRQGYIDYTVKEFISEEDYLKRQSRGISHKGDLLFTTEAPMGYAAIADLEKYSAGQRLITLQQYTNTDHLDNRFYMYYISTKFFQKQLDAKCSGTTVKGIKADRLKLFLVPLPPLAEQKRIIARLEELLPLCGKLK